MRRVAAVAAAGPVLASGCTSPATEAASAPSTPPLDHPATTPAPSTDALTSFEMPDQTVVALNRVPTAEHPHLPLEVRTGGVVTTTGVGCLGFEDGIGGHLVAVWPATTAPLADGTGIAVPGLGAVRVGDQVHAAQRGHLGQAPPGDLDAGLPASCQNEAGTLALTGFTAASSN